MSNFVTNLNNKYCVTGKLKKATNFFKDNKLDIGEAVVSILESNGISGFKFHIPQTEQVKFESEITDNYTALNTAYQDHIALKPVTITVTGLQGEYFYDLHPIENIVSTVASGIRLVEAFLPKLTKVAVAIKDRQLTINKPDSKTYDVASDSYEYENDYSAIELWGLFQNLFKLKSAQTRAFMFFEHLWRTRAMFTVETSWKKFDNMIIQSLTPYRNNNADITEFSITFKQMQFAQTIKVDINALGNRKYQQEPLDIKALVKGKKLSPKMSYTQGISEIV